jgi:hypothetical protein
LEQQPVSPFVEQAVRDGYQSFFQPKSVALPAGVSLNAKGWLDCPTQSDLVITLYEEPPGTDETIYWLSELVITNSSARIEMALEGNFVWDSANNQPSADGWQVTTPYNVSLGDPHFVEGTFIKTVPGESLRLRVTAAVGNDRDFYFKFRALRLPWVE